MVMKILVRKQNLLDKLTFNSSELRNKSFRFHSNLAEFKLQMGLLWLSRLEFYGQ